MFSRRRFLGAALALAAAAAVTGCEAEKPKSDLTYRLSHADGGPPTGDQLRRVENELDTRLQREGYDRRNVVTLGNDRVRISLPENVAAEIPAIRKALEGGDRWAELKVKLTLVAGQGVDR
jgi:hypothetical protein